jgi:hypothetical protein
MSNWHFQGLETYPGVVRFLFQSDKDNPLSITVTRDDAKQMADELSAVLSGTAKEGD